MDLRERVRVKEKSRAERILIALLSSTSAPSHSSAPLPLCRKGPESAGGVRWWGDGVGDSLMGWGTSGKWTLMKDKGMKQRDGYLCECVCVHVHVCVSLGGGGDYKGPQILRESVIGREIGNWD